jgi:hypothetical protein
LWDLMKREAVIAVAAVEFAARVRAVAGGGGMTSGASERLREALEEYDRATRITCRWCGERIGGRRRRYCNAECRYRGELAKRKMDGKKREYAREYARRKRNEKNGGSHEDGLRADGVEGGRSGVDEVG